MDLTVVDKIEDNELLIQSGLFSIVGRWEIWVSLMVCGCEIQNLELSNMV